jgi:hypothetical protein
VNIEQDVRKRIAHRVWFEHGHESHGAYYLYRRGEKRGVAGEENWAVNNYDFPTTEEVILVALNMKLLTEADIAAAIAAERKVQEEAWCRRWKVAGAFINTVPFETVVKLVRWWAGTSATSTMEVLCTNALADGVAVGIIAESTLI